MSSPLVLNKPHPDPLLNKEIKNTESEILTDLADWKSIIRPYQFSDTRKATLQIITSLGPYLTSVTLMYFALDFSYLLFGALAILNGFLLSRIFIIQHDCGHFSFFKSTKSNQVVGYIMSLFTTIPFSYWAKVHNFHHGHNGQLEFREIGDIYFATVDEYTRMGKWKKMGYRAFRSFPGIVFLAPFIYMVFSNRFPLFNLKGWKKNVRRSQILNNLVLIGFYGSLMAIFGVKEVALVMGFSVYAFGIVAFWFFFVQHQHEEAYKQWKKNWNHIMASIKGSTFYDLPRVFHWFSGNIGYHHIHHLSPRIPSYNLVQCAEENPILQKHVTFLSFRDSVATVQNKLWDERQNRMIGFNEYKQQIAALEEESSRLTGLS